MKPIISCLQVSDLYNFTLPLSIFIKCISPYIVMFILHKSAYPLFCTEYHIAVIQFFQCMSPKDNVTRRADRNTGSDVFSQVFHHIRQRDRFQFPLHRRLNPLQLVVQNIMDILSTGQSGFGFS